MRPLGVEKATLADLLDRVLDKGLVLHLDLLVCVSGVPLLGVSLRALLGGMETLLKHGIMADWDVAQRAAAMDSRPLPLEPGERLIDRIPALVKGPEGADRGAHPGWVYVTDRRVVAQAAGCPPVEVGDPVVCQTGDGAGSWLLLRGAGGGAVGVLPARGARDLVRVLGERAGSAAGEAFGREGGDGHGRIGAPAGDAACALRG